MITRTAPSWHTEDWQNQLSTAISKVGDLLELLNLSQQDLPAQLQAHNDFPLRVPKGYLSKIQPGNPLDPLLLQILPQAQELIATPGYSDDPLQEAKASPVPGLIHKYKSRVLLTTSSACAIHCRYCFRRHFPYSDNQISQHDIQAIQEYLRTQPDVNEVILSGGDPLATSNRRLQQLIKALENLPQIKRLRIHTRFPVVIPQRIDQQLLAIIEASKLNWIMVVHCNHAQELDEDFIHAMTLIKERGVTLLNQSVLLKGINDDSAALVNLSEALFDAGIMPYYLHLLDAVRGAHHFDVTKDAALEIYQDLLTELPGFLVPKLVREDPNTASKTPITP